MRFFVVYSRLCQNAKLAISRARGHWGLPLVWLAGITLGVCLALLVTESEYVCTVAKMLAGSRPFGPAFAGYLALLTVGHAVVYVNCRLRKRVLVGVYFVFAGFFVGRAVTLSIAVSAVVGAVSAFLFVLPCALLCFFVVYLLAIELSSVVLTTLNFSCNRRVLVRIGRYWLVGAAALAVFVLIIWGGIELIIVAV